MTTVQSRCFTPRKDVTAKQQLAFDVKRFLRRKTLLKLKSYSAARALPGDARRLHCRGDKPGIRPGGRVTFFASPKKVTKKRRPGDRAPLRGVPVPAVPGAGRSTGFHCNGHFKSNGNGRSHCNINGRSHCNINGRSHCNCNGFGKFHAPRTLHQIADWAERWAAYCASGMAPRAGCSLAPDGLRRAVPPCARQFQTRCSSRHPGRAAAPRR